MKVLVCGGREFRDEQRAFSALDDVHTSFDRIHAVIHGACTGADSLAERWAKMREVTYIGEPAKWTTLGNAAGPIRNMDMIRKWEPDLVIAFPGGVGTADMVAKAKSRGILVRQG